MTLKNLRFGRLATTFAFIFAVIVAQFANVQFASAATLTWDGSAGDNLFSTAANWNTDSVPVDGDIISFAPLSSGAEFESITLNNNLVGIELGGIISTLSGTGISKSFSINTITLQDAASLTTTGTGANRGSVTFSQPSDTFFGTGEIIALGNLTIGSNFNVGAKLSVTGNLTSTSGITTAPTSTIGGSFTNTAWTILNSTIIGGTITIPNNAQGIYYKGATQTVANNFVFNDFDATVFANQIGFGSCSQEPLGGGAGSSPVPIVVYCQAYGTAIFTLTGNITLNADLIIAVATNSTVRITGNITYNGHTITLENGSQGTLEVGGGAVTVPETTSSYDGESAATQTVANKETATLNGTRGLIFVSGGGVLKGTGTANTVSTSPGSIIAPGNSPGKLTVLSTLALSGTYQAELLNKDTYDQLAVGANYSSGGNAVSLFNGAVLDTVLYNGWSVTQGDQFRIIDNQSSTAVFGTFTGLAEGAQFTETDGAVTITFSITYVGGDGNDVVITALNTGSDPTPPNTGALRIVMANPIVLAGLGIITAAILAYAATRRRTTN